MSEEPLFHEALARPPAERAAYLDAACAGKPELRAAVEALLAASERPDSFLNRPARAVATVEEPRILEGPGTVIGPYKLLQKLGEGGFGIVYMAEQTQPVRRMVALKIIKPGMDTAQVIARFESERQALALMEHPNIARVFDAGCTSGPEGAGRPYFVMELVKGVPITEFCDRNRLAPEARLKLFIDVCHAIQHAHQKGVIHRDIKPSNVMVTLHDGVPVVKVIDFGVAKATVQRLTERTLFTAYGQMIGTPAYMSPEQAEMSGLDVDTRSDVYSLGVLLYELLTGTTPLETKRLREAGYAEMQRLIREEEAPRPSLRLSSLGGEATVLAGNRGLDPRRLVQFLSGDLDWIVMKALEKDRTRRYSSPGNFAEDVDRYLRREAILARPPSTLYRLRKFAQRNRAACFIVLFVTASVLAILTNALLMTWRIRWERDRAVAAAKAEMAARDAAQRERDRAVEAERAASAALGREEEAGRKTTLALNEMALARERERVTAYVHRIALAQREWLADEVGRAGQLLDECPADLRQWEWRYLRRLCNAERVSFSGHPSEVNAVAFSPDGSRIASVSWKDACIWDAVTGKEIFKVPGRKTNWGRGAAFSQDGKRLALAGFQTVTIHDAADGRELSSIRAHDTLVAGVAFSPDGRRLATASGSRVGFKGEVKVWEVETGKQVHAFTDLSHWANAVAFSPDGKQLAAGTGNLAILGGGEAPEANRGQVLIWDIETGKLLHDLEGHTFWVTDVAFSPDGQRLASSGADGTVRAWDLPAGKESLTLRGHTGPVRRIAYSPQGNRLASVGEDRLVRVWDVTPGTAPGPPRILRGHLHRLAVVAFSPDGRFLVSAGGNRNGGEVRVWDALADQQAQTFRDHPSAVKSIAFSPDAKLLASVGSTFYHGEAVVRELATGVVRPPIRKEFGFFDVAFLPDGSAFATAGAEGASLWNPATLASLRLLPVHGQPMGGVGTATNGLAISADGQRVATVGTTGLTVWELAAGRVLLQIRAHPLFEHINCEKHVAFSPDGRRLATSTRGANARGKVDGVEKLATLLPEVKVWDVETGKEQLRLAGGGGGVEFSPDGTRLASGNADGTATVWDAATGKVVHTLRGHANSVSTVAFAPGGRRLATGSDDHTVKVWDVTIGQEVLTLRGHGEPVVRVAFSPDGRYLASASSQLVQAGRVLLWDAGPARSGAFAPGASGCGERSPSASEASAANLRSRSGSDPSPGAIGVRGASRSTIVPAIR